MRLGSIVSELTALRRGDMSSQYESRLIELSDFGSNPGALDAKIYVPKNLPNAAALVVPLHGCTQTAAQYDRGSGWSQLADRHGFALLYPQQRRANNANLCFNWYAPADARRGRGETLSIVQMIDRMATMYQVDRERIFVTGLSAGGAMTAVMLGSYPELFAGGAIIAGLPFASANSLSEALERMRGTGGPTKRKLGLRGSGGAPTSGCAPTLSVWHGTHDSIVSPSNATSIVEEWRSLYRLDETTSVVDRIAGHRHESWKDANGRVVLERYDVEGMGHGIPLNTHASPACGVAGPHMLDAGICSTRHIAQTWGLTGPADDLPDAIHQSAESPLQPHTSVPATGVEFAIERALRAAGLMH